MPKALTPRPGGGQGPPSGARAVRSAPGRDGGAPARHPSHPGPRRALAPVARRRSCWSAATRERPSPKPTKAKQLSPRSASVREVLGLALYGQERWQEALTELKAYRRMSGRADQNHVIADCLRARGQARGGGPARPRRSSGPRCPNDAKAEAVIVAASALADQGRFAEALAFLGGRKTKDGRRRAVHPASLVRARRHPGQGGSRR